MKKIYIGILLLIVAFILIALWIHNLEYWVYVTWWSLNITTVGALLIIFSLREQLRTHRWYTTLFVPRKWYIGIASLVSFILVLTFLYAVIKKSGIYANEKLKTYYLQGKTVETTATVLGMIKVSYTLKSTYHQQFIAIEYMTPDGIMRQGLDAKQFTHLIPGKKIPIIYSRDQPSVFKLE